jgi:hypothetical protein
MAPKHHATSVLTSVLKKNSKEKVMNRLTPKNTKAFSRRTFAVAGLAAAISLAGCSSDNPDEGGSVASTSVSGLAVDGYIAGATVYVDYNNNGRKNAGEPSAITDQNGYFSTAKDGTDYCANDATALQKIHCLKTSETGNGFVLRTFGGFDLYTGEPFTGSLSRRVSIGDDGVIANQMISPLTSMLVDIPDEADQTALLNVFGLAADDLDADFLDSDGFTALRVNAATKLHKVVTLFSEVFSDHYEEIGDERGFPETPNAIIYKALAEHLAESDLLDQGALMAAFNNAQTAIRALYDNDEDLFPPASLNGAAVVQDALDILGLVDNAVPPSTVFADAKSRVIGIETVLKKMVDGDPDVAAAVAEASNTESALYTAIENALAVVGGDVDFTALTDVNFAAPDYSGVGIVGGGSFADLTNKQLFVSLNDGLATGSGYLFFNSEQGASGGELKVCLGYDDGEAGEPEFEETAGVLLSGSWLALDDSKLILTLAGSLTLSLADKGLTGQNQHRYTLSYGGETRSWLSDDGLQDELESQNVATQPTDDASCEALLSPPQA